MSKGLWKGRSVLIFFLCPFSRLKKEAPHWYPSISQSCSRFSHEAATDAVESALVISGTLIEERQSATVALRLMKSVLKLAHESIVSTGVIHQALPPQLRFISVME
jgi:hypothetical protein